MAETPKDKSPIQNIVNKMKSGEPVDSRDIWESLAAPILPDRGEDASLMRKYLLPDVPAGQNRDTVAHMPNLESPRTELEGNKVSLERATVQATKQQYAAIKDEISEVILIAKTHDDTVKALADQNEQAIKVRDVHLKGGNYDEMRKMEAIFNAVKGSLQIQADKSPVISQKLDSYLSKTRELLRAEEAKTAQAGPKPTK